MTWQRTALGDWLSADGRWRVRGPLMGKRMFWLFLNGARYTPTGRFEDAPSFATAAHRPNGSWPNFLLDNRHAMSDTGTIMTAATTQRIKTFTDWFIRSDYMANFSGSRVADGGFARPLTDARERYDRCMAAVEHGADGSTHGEIIQDWRDGFEAWIYDQRRGRNRWMPPSRFINAVFAEFDAVEDWHRTNDSLDQEIG